MTTHPALPRSLELERVLSPERTFLVRNRSLPGLLVLKRCTGRKPRLESRLRALPRATATSLVLEHGLMELDGSLYSLRPFVEGRTLRELRGTEGAAPAPVAMTLLESVAAGLGELHQRGLPHGRVHSRNVIVDGQGQVRLVDCLDVGAPVSPAARGAVEFLELSASPEQLRGAPATARSDVYGLGLLAFDLFAGRHPVSGEAWLELVRRALYEEPFFSLAEAQGIPPGLAPLVQQALAKQPFHRFASVARMVAGLRTLPLPRGDAPSRSLHPIPQLAGEGRIPVVHFPPAETPPLPAFHPTAQMYPLPALPPVETLPAPAFHPTAQMYPLQALPPAPAELAPPPPVPAHEPLTLAGTTARVRGSLTRAGSTAEFVAIGVLERWWHTRPLVRLGVPLLAGIALFSSVGGWRLFQGRALEREVEELLEKNQPARAHDLLLSQLRRGEDDVTVNKLLGDVACARGESDECLRLYQAVLERSSRYTDDARLQHNALALLDHADRRGVVAQVAARLDDVEDRLVEETRSTSYWKRWNSVRALEARGSEGSIPYGVVYALDVLHGGSCSTRRAALSRLAQLKDPESLPYLEKARSKASGRLFGDFCLGDDLERVIRAIENPG